MNLYFLLEGKRSESRVYPKWLTYLLPEITRISNYMHVTDNNYYLISGEGYPSILNHLENAIKDINTIDKYNYLILCIDSEESTVIEKTEEVQRYLKSRNLTLNYATLKIIIQNRTFETWCLGNKKAFPRNPIDKTFVNYTKFYNVSSSDPELMGVYPNFSNHAEFHLSYLKLMLREKNILYTKNFPREVQENYYLEALIDRIETDNHLCTFKNFYDFCESLKNSNLMN